jgi:hypothetical protein
VRELRAGAAFVRGIDDSQVTTALDLAPVREMMTWR